GAVDTASDGAASSKADTALVGATGGAAAEPAPIKPHVIDVNSVNDNIELDLIGTYAQSVKWGVGGSTTLTIDEPEPLGENSGPSPARVLSAALASCLGASLLFCLRKSKVDVMGLHTTASTDLVRNERGRLRVGTITVRLEPVVPLEQHDRMARCIEVFEDYCIVTASVRPSVTVNVFVNPVSPPAH
ncbi:MAG: OsmC family protein, partial [Gemmatimonas sp.]